MNLLKTSCVSDAGISMGFFLCILLSDAAMLVNQHQTRTNQNEPAWITI